MKTIAISLLVVLNSIALPERSASTYDEVLHSLSRTKSQLVFNKSLEGTDVNQRLSDLLYVTLRDSIFPAWYGTVWDFNGITNVPSQGEIACGYFVSTTLKHAGFNLNRYKLAQQGATEIATAVCGSNTMTRFTSLDKAITHVSQSKNGLYIVGLDFHVGFLLVEAGEVFFVHSDYFNGKVVREAAKTSQGLNSSEVYVLGEITNNNRLMADWTNGIKLY
jgi:hypothetical protein